MCYFLSGRFRRDNYALWSSLVRSIRCHALYHLAWYKRPTTKDWQEAVLSRALVGYGDADIVVFG